MEDAKEAKIITLGTLRYTGMVINRGNYNVFPLILELNNNSTELLLRAVKSDSSLRSSCFHREAVFKSGCLKLSKRF